MVATWRGWPVCMAEDAELAVRAARASFARGDWAHQAPAQRKRVLIAFAELLLAHAEELALLETLDMGKPISDSLAIDVPAQPTPCAGAPRPLTRSMTRWRPPRATSWAW